MQQKNLILSYATNVAYEDLSRLLRSARAHIPVDTADIVIITNPQADRFAALAHELSVELAPAMSLWKHVQSSRALRGLFRGLFTLFELQSRFARSVSWSTIHAIMTSLWSHPIVSRHFAFLEFLALRPNYRTVLLTDARDVVFQGDPFPLLPPANLHAFLQDGGLRYGQRNMDTDWYRNVLGPEELARVQGNAVACAGTIAGGVAVIKKLLQEMTRTIVERKRGVIDQPVYNFVLRHRMADAVVFHENGKSPILTLGDMPEGQFDLVGDQVVVGGKTPTVLHQYDRVPSVRDAIARRFG
jgi:hypothetical protein